jgi:hypothetical protein
VIKKLSELKPYKSLLLARVQSSAPVKGVVDNLLTDLRELLSLGEDGPRTLISEVSEINARELAVGYLHYSEETPAPWTLNRNVVDQINHLILVCRRNRHLAIYLSDTRWRSGIVKQFGKTGTKGLSLLHRIPPGLLNAAFIKGAARTLWLSGAHARTSIKADNKILSGIELQDALDPLGDQTYYFTAARCASDFDEDIVAVGTSPRGSRIWVGSSRTWDEFANPVNAILKHLEATITPVDAPIPVVAVSSIDTTKIADAFDLGIIPPELLSDETNERAREEMEEWAYYSHFRILKKSNADFTAEVTLNGTLLGTIEFQIDFADPENVKWRMESRAASDETEEALARAVTVCNRPTWVKIWYESGHTIAEGHVLKIRHRDMPFQDFSWVDFSGYDVTKEKPSTLDLAVIGEENSLFCWVKNSWPLDGFGDSAGGWLACDDGSMELADFIHLDDKSVPPRLSLIHIKASDNASPNRGVSVSDYEIVTSQAVKNFRYLDRTILTEGLESGVGKKVGKLVWYNRRRAKQGRTGMLKALQNIGTNYRRQVVIIQPRLTQAREEYARKHTKSRDAARLRQLDTLLLEQENSCHGLQASLSVICAKEPAAKLPGLKKKK